MTEIIATYLINEPTSNFAKKADGIAIGLTVGSWTDLPQLEQEQLKKHKGRVESITELDKTRALIKIGYPTENFSSDLPAILTTVFGKLSLDGEIKLLDLVFPEQLKSAFPGPKFGVSGIRAKAGVFDRPLLMSIFKGVIGRDLDFVVEQMKTQAFGGVDLVKDDEILFDNQLTSFEQRITACRNVLTEAYEETGHRTLYAVNLTGRTFELIEKAKRAEALGADVLLFNVFAYGLDVMQTLAETVDLPLMAHPAVSGALTASPKYGIASSLLLGKLLRYAGADLVLFPSPYGSVALERPIALNIAKELTKHEPNFKPSFPVPSAGIHPGLVPLLYADFGSDSVINAGGGVHGHPGGPTSGGIAFRQAIDAVLTGQSLQEAATTQQALKQAIDLWGNFEVTT